MPVIDNVFFIIIQLLCFTVGSNVVSRLIFSHYSPPALTAFRSSTYIPHVLFAITLSSSCALFLLVLGEITNHLSKTTRWHYWHANLSILLINVILIIPWYQTFAFLRHTRVWSFRTSIYVSTIVWCGYLYLFYNVGYTPSSGTMEDPSTYSWTELGIFRVSTVGITIISLLSGFGVVNAPYSTFKIFARPVSERDYAVAERAYEQTMTVINDKKKALDNLQKATSADVNNGGTSLGSIGRLMTSIVGGSRQDEHSLLQLEIEQLEHLAANMKLDLDELSRGRFQSRFAKTWKGRCWSLVTSLFAVYCVYKLIATTLNVVFRRVGSTDPITNMLSLMISHFGDSDKIVIDTTFWSQQLSFWFAGIIVFGSIRGFLTILNKILLMFSQRVSFSIIHLLLLAAHMMGMYFLSSVLMMQTSLPPEYRYLMSSSLGRIKFDFFRRWSDIIFVIASFVTMAILYVIHQTSDARHMAQDFADVQLLSAETGQGREESIELHRRL
ncbi:Abscisic acid G-protein coupled receptor-domain-containing protein [Radiomyces spectabilis]|uniref:Abscisic acid G-protein coupled receptor-domain-containing protein n=1 Tax=Radiomyces spectabilis TaxID=64574 RepID=UPI002220EF0D|nr:Abscisic acid G-protein coupled receptor-domain-containing protein [Radiomyces spectabilis]KAI8384486.1 Abscisic acid G-protein coupled receptor-domain-containing protein [Radiomyces spectabilis]